MYIYIQELGVQVWVNYVQARLPNEDPLRIIQEIFKRNLDVIQVLLDSASFFYSRDGSIKEPTENGYRVQPIYKEVISDDLMPRSTAIQYNRHTAFTMIKLFLFSICL